MANNLTLPDPVAARLDQLVQSLRDILGDKLAAIVAHGSATRGEYREASDVDLAIVVSADDLATLAAIGPALELARFSARIEAIIVTRDEIAQSSDCFPLFYGDLADGVALHGKNPFVELEIAAVHKRLRIEQELREVRIRMRRVATDLSNQPMFANAIDRKIKQARSPLRALLALRGRAVAADLGGVLDAACTEFSGDVVALKRVREDARAAYRALCDLIDHALKIVDEMEV